MSWSVYYWVWRLEEPVYIGMSPAKSLSRCRPYLPARTMHGAVTAELARLSFDENPKLLSEPDYGKFGWEIGISCRFTYLYPAKKTEDHFVPWLPKYVMHPTSPELRRSGLCWFLDAVPDDPPQSDRDFRRCLMDALASTAVASEHDSALDGSLHETEYINTKWRRCDKKEGSSQVYFVGYVFLKNNAFLQKIQSVETLWIGGDSRYGLGKIQRVVWEPQDNSRVFGASVYLDDACAPVLKTNHVLAHAYSDLPLWGMKELVGGWNIKKPWIHQGQELPAWSPGSLTCKEEQCWMIDTYGIWRASSDGS
jgi:hypothetical protein